MSNSKPALKVEVKPEKVESRRSSSASKAAPPSPTRGIGLFKTFTNNRSRSVSNSKKIEKSNSSIFVGDGQFIDFETNATMILEIDPKKLNTLQKAVNDNDIKKVTKLIAEKDRQIDKLDSEHGITSLFLAATLGHVELAKLFLEGTKKSNPDLQCGEFNRTALIQAVINQKDTMVAYLISQNANVDIKDKWGCSAVSYTLASKEITALKSLLKAKPNLEFNDKTGMGPLHHAARLGKASHSKCLIQGGCSVEVRDEQDRTPLHHAIKSGSVRVVEILLKLGASTAAQDMHSKTVLDYLAAAEFNKDISDAIETAKKNNQTEQADNEESSRRYSVLSTASASNYVTNEGITRNSPSISHKKENNTDSIYSVSSMGTADLDSSPDRSPSQSNHRSPLQNESILSNLAKLGDIQEHANESQSHTPIGNTPKAQTPIGNTPRASMVDLNAEADNISTNSEKYLELIARYEFEILKLIEQVEEEQKSKVAQGLEYNSALEQLATLDANLSEIKELYEGSVLQMNELQYEKDMLALEVENLNQLIQGTNTEQTKEKIEILQMELKLKEDYITELESRVNLSDSRLARLTENLEKERAIAKEASLDRSLSVSSFELATVQNNAIQKLQQKDDKIFALEKHVETSNNELDVLRVALASSIKINGDLQSVSNSPLKYTDTENKLVGCELEILSMQKIIDKQTNEISNMKQANDRNDTEYLEASIKTLESVLCEKESRIVYIESKLDEANKNEDNAITLRKTIRFKDDAIEDLTTENVKLREKSGAELKEKHLSMDYLGFMTDIDDQIQTLEKVVEEKNSIISNLEQTALAHAKEIETIKKTSNNQAKSNESAIEKDVKKMSDMIDNLRQRRQPDSGFGSTPNKIGDFNNGKILESVMQNLSSTLNAMADLGLLKTQIKCNNAIVQTFQHSLSDYVELMNTDLSIMNDNLTAYSKMKVESVPSKSRTQSVSTFDAARDEKVLVLEKNLKVKDAIIEKYEKEISESKSIAPKNVDNQIAQVKEDMLKSKKMHESVIQDQKLMFEKEIAKLQAEMIKHKDMNDDVVAEQRKNHEKNSITNKKLIEQKGTEVNTLKAEILLRNEEMNALETQKAMIERELEAKLVLLSSDSHVDKLEMKTKISSLERNIQKLNNDKNLLQIQLDDALVEVKIKAEEIENLILQRLDEQAHFEPALAEKERQVTMLKQEIQVITIDKENFVRNVRELQDERVQLERKVADISRQCESLQSSHEMQLLAKEAQAQNVKNNCAGLEAEKVRLNNETSKLNVIIQDLHGNFDSLKQKHHDLSSISYAKDGQIAEFQHQIQSLHEFKHQVEQLQGELTSATISKKQSHEMETKCHHLTTMLESTTEKMNTIRRAHEGLQNQHDKQNESVIMKTQRIRDLEEELTTSREQVILTAQLEEMLKHQHHEISQQLQKHGITLSTQQSSSLETYIKVQQEAIASLEEMLTNMQVHHQSQIDHYHSLHASLNQKQQQNEIRMHGYEQEISHLRNLLTEYKQKVMFLENKLEDAHRIHIDLKDEQSDILLQNQTQQQLMGTKYASLKDDAHKLQNKIVVLMKSKTEGEEELQNAYDSHVHKILKRIEAQSQNRATLEEAKKLSQVALVDTYEQHIKTLTIELNALRTNALKSTVQKTGRRY